MSPRALFLLIAALAPAGSAPALADSTVSETVPPGGSLRSSTDAAPSAANPVIVTVTTAAGWGECRTNCSDGDSQITIALRDAHQRSNRAGTNPTDFVGPQIDVTSSQTLNIERIVFELDASLVRPDFSFSGAAQFMSMTTRPGDSMPQPAQFMKPGSMFGDGAIMEVLPGGGVRLIEQRAQTGPVLASGSIDLLQQGWYVIGYEADDDLTAALGHGVDVQVAPSYRAAETWRITVSPAVARKLKLKSTTIGQASFRQLGAGNRRIPLTAAARKALRKYSRVVVKVDLAAKTADGEIHHDVRPLTLAKPKEELS